MSSLASVTCKSGSEPGHLGSSLLNSLPKPLRYYKNSLSTNVIIKTWKSYLQVLETHSGVCSGATYLLVSQTFKWTYTLQIRVFWEGNEDAFLHSSKPASSLMRAATSLLTLAKPPISLDLLLLFFVFFQALLMHRSHCTLMITLWTCCDSFYALSQLTLHHHYIKNIIMMLWQLNVLWIIILFYLIKYIFHGQVKIKMLRALK